MFVTFLANAFDERWALRELEAENDETERVSIEQQRLLAEIAHELRPPLVVIAGMTQLVERHPDARDRVELAARAIRVNALRLSTMIDGLLDAEAREMGALQEASREVDLAELIDEIAQHAQHLITRGGVEFGFSGSGTVAAPPLALHRLLLNLVANAVRYTEAGRVELRAEQAPDGVVVAVSDTGPGMSVEERERYRIPYERGKTSVGFGRGLSIVGRLARVLGAQLDIASTSGVGTTVRLRCPR